MPAPELAGVRVLVTRPAHQAEALCRLVEQAGGEAIRLPALAIEPVTTAEIMALGVRLARYTLAIFISPNAVDCACDRVGEWPVGVRTAAVGQGTARALARRLGRGPDLVPAARFDSEGLLALPELQAMGGERVLILRGEGGRELLAQTLRARGAQVDYAEVYRRVTPHGEAVALARLERGEVDIVTVSSSEGLRTLLELAGEAAGAQLRRLPLVMLSERTATLAGTLGFQGPFLVADEASDRGIMAAIVRWARNRERCNE